jgi:dTDP-glucose 4,6-dehydratase
MTPAACNYDIGNDVDVLLARAGLNTELLRGKCVFVTGATGFFGIWMLSALVRIKRALSGELKLVALSRNSTGFLEMHSGFEFEREVDFITGDVGHFKYLQGDVTHLVHMATTNAAETFAGQPQFSKLDMLYKGTQNVLNQCAGRLESVLMTSSGVAYGNIHHDKIVESDQGKLETTDLRSALALGKLVAEYMVSSFATSFQSHAAFHLQVLTCPWICTMPLEISYAMPSAKKRYAFGGMVWTGVHTCMWVTLWLGC